jgi:hypothetical protein
MSEAVVLEFKGVTGDDYGAVNKILGLDPASGGGDWPAGMLSHTGAVGPGDTLLVFEVWDSQASQAEFMGSRLGPALGSVGVPEPTRLEWLSVVGHHHS